MDKLYTVEEVAEILHITPASVRRYLRDGEMVGVQLRRKWLVSEQQLQDFIKSHSSQPKVKGQG